MVSIYTKYKHTQYIHKIQNGEHKYKIYTKMLSRSRNVNRTCADCHRADINKETLEF